MYYWFLLSNHCLHCYRWAFTAGSICTLRSSLSPTEKWRMLPPWAKATTIPRIYAWEWEKTWNILSSLSSLANIAIFLLMGLQVAGGEGGKWTKNQHLHRASYVWMPTFNPIPHRTVTRNHVTGQKRSTDYPQSRLITVICLSGQKWIML